MQKSKIHEAIILTGPSGAGKTTAINVLEDIGFEYVKQLNGGCETDFDRPFCEDKFFEKKFGSGDLRLLFRKV